MKIKVKRATFEGVVEDNGDFFEVNGRQFCLVKDKRLYLVIELSTGCSVINYNVDDYTKKKAIQFAKEIIELKTESQWEYALNKVAVDFCKRYNFTMPVNEPITIKN